MPTYDTPQPITAVIDVEAGTVRISAGKRTDTVVEVLPRDGASDNDVRSARQTQVSCADGTLRVKGPRTRSPFNKGGLIEVSVELPAGSEVRAATGLGNVLCEGPLGACTLKTGLGDIQLGEATTVDLKTSTGEIRLAHATGDAEIGGMGLVEIDTVDGSATVKNGNGETRIGAVGGALELKSSNGAASVGSVHGEVRAKSANGPIEIGVAQAGVEASSAMGGIKVGEVARGKVTLRTSIGNVEVGIREGTAAWLDVHTKFGSVRNTLGGADGPGGATDTVEVRANTSGGDIVIHRA
ncbi:DUF4097 domain-containing protein [Streptomyces monticola]|uniref:DUF4097 domain-containing protein n=1 Tax=Streptomyces monticola TaxID=2666263 RepID=A0ABW2JVZ8_9ACTN